MRRDSYLGNPRYTNLILTLDQQYVRSLSQSLFGDTKVDKAHFVHRSCYFKPEFSCCLCGAGNKRRGNRPAAFFPTEVGYIYTCLACNPSLTLYQFLRDQQPAVASDYQKDRWINKLTGRGFNCPDPPKNIRKEHYQQIEREIKEKNQLEYKRKHGLI
jgi:hypothetical protein